MQTISRLLTDAASLLNWSAEAVSVIRAEAQDLGAALTGHQTITANIAEIRHTLTITQEQVDQLTSEINANTDAIALASQSIEPLKASIAETSKQIKALIDKLASAGVPFNTAALDAALTASTTQAKAIAESLASTPAPVIPTDPTTPTDTTATAPAAAAETVQAPA